MVGRGCNTQPRDVRHQNKANAHMQVYAPKPHTPAISGFARLSLLGTGALSVQVLGLLNQESTSGRIGRRGDQLL